MTSSAESEKARAQVTVEKQLKPKISPVSKPYQTGNSGLYVVSSPDSQAKLDAANGNVYALAINTEGVKRATCVVHVNGRTLLVADPSRYKESVAKSAAPKPVTLATTDSPAK